MYSSLVNAQFKHIRKLFAKLTIKKEVRVGLTMYSAQTLR